MGSRACRGGVAAAVGVVGRRLGLVCGAVLVVLVVLLPVSVAAARKRTVALLAWGANNEGQLGDGTTTNSHVPVKVKLPKGITVTDMAAGSGHTLAVTSTGSVLAWGDNSNGQLGDGTTTSSDLPVKVKLPQGTKVTAVSGGNLHSLALTSTGAVLAWGYNTDGELGNGTTTGSDLPVKVMLPQGTKVTMIAAGTSTSLALTSTGSVLAWGSNADGELGNGNTTDSDVPVKVKLPKGTKAIRVAAGSEGGLTLTSTGSVLAWGSNTEGQLGNGTTTSSDLPVRVMLPKGTKATLVVAGGFHSLALTSTGTLLAWGFNLNGELGDGNTTNTDLPVKVKLPKGTKVRGLAGGANYTVALTSIGSLLAWGFNMDGELGDGKSRASDIPVKVKLPTSTVATAAHAGRDAEHSLALVHHT